MARIRYLKPDTFTDEDMAALPFWVRLLYMGLWVNADKAGRLEDRPDQLKAKIFPYEYVDIEAGLTALEQIKKYSKQPFIHRYTSDGFGYIQIISWKKHQKPHHTEKESEIPPPPNLPLFNINNKSKDKGNGEFKPAQIYCEVKEPLNNRYSNEASEIIKAWNALPIRNDLKIKPANEITIEYEIAQLSHNPQTPLQIPAIIEAIENYRKALEIPDSQAHQHSPLLWLKKHVFSYIDGAFNIENYRKSNFDKGKKKESVEDRFNKLKQEGVL